MKKRTQENLYTKSVSVMLGADRCPELDQLERALRRDREFDWQREVLDKHVAGWKARIEWAKPTELSRLMALPLEELAEEAVRERSWSEWMDYLIEVQCRRMGLPFDMYGRPTEPCGRAFDREYLGHPGMHIGGLLPGLFVDEVEDSS